MTTPRATIAASGNARRMPPESCTGERRPAAAVSGHRRARDATQRRLNVPPPKVVARSALASERIVTEYAYVPRRSLKLLNRGQTFQYALPTPVIVRTTEPRAFRLPPRRTTLARYVKFSSAFSEKPRVPSHETRAPTTVVACSHGVAVPRLPEAIGFRRTVAAVLRVALALTSLDCAQSRTLPPLEGPNKG